MRFFFYSILNSFEAHLGSMIGIIKKNKPVFGIYIIFLITGACLLIFTGKGDIYRWINSHHNPFFDFFFYYITSLGNGITFIVFVIIFLFIRFRKSLLLLFSFLLHIIPVQFTKQVLIPKMQRPTAYFSHMLREGELHIIENVELHSRHSFPSGHTASAFALFFMLIFFIKNESLKLFLLFLALAVGYSRIYLSQHFFIDIYFGSLIGSLCSMIIYYLFYHKENFIFRSKMKLDSSLLNKKYEA